MLTFIKVAIIWIKKEVLSLHPIKFSGKNTAETGDGVKDIDFFFLYNITCCSFYGQKRMWLNSWSVISPDSSKIARGGDISLTGCMQGMKTLIKEDPGTSIHWEDMSNSQTHVYAADAWC